MIKPILVTLLFFSCKKSDVPTEQSVTVYQVPASWYIKVTALPAPFKQYVAVETQHKIYPAVHNCVVIGAGNHSFVYKIPSSFGPVTGWRVLEWGRWRD